MSVIPKKSLGQNFLMHAQTAERIAQAASLPSNATVLEIGPGTGMLTDALLRHVGEAGKVLAIETDATLVPILHERFADAIASGRLQIELADIRACDLRALTEGSEYHVVANIPYYITGDIVRMLLEATHKPASITILVQKEVAERIARPHGKESVLSIAVAAYGTSKYCFTVPRGAFKPSPNVDSAVLNIANIRQDAFVTPEQEHKFFKVVKAGFAHKRKMLSKNLEGFFLEGELATVLNELGLSPTTRAEVLSVESWRALTDAATVP